ncbi:MAG: RNA polymerase sigma factor [Planctomycetota bacterium]|jgi:RNA polymerase sigma-70 factor (ECF subfamily)
MTRDHRPESPHGQHLADLFREHGDGLAGAVRGVLGSADVQEILQEAFLRAFRALQDGFAPRHPVAWIFVITMNLARDQRRKDQRRHGAGGTGRTVQALEDVNPMELQSKEPAPSAGLEREEALAAARDAIHELKPAEREVFLLRTSAGLSFQEAAEALRIPIGTAKTRMRAALARLRRSLTAHMPLPAPAVQPIRSLATDSPENIDIQRRGRRKTS